MIKRKKISNRYIRLMLILLPLMAALILNLSPRPQSILESWWLVNRGTRSAKPALTIDGLNQLFVWQPWRDELRRESARLSYQMKDWAAVIQTYKQINMEASLTVEDQQRLAEAYRQLGELDQAGQVWQHLVELGEADIREYWNLAALQRSRGDWSGLKTTLRSLLAREPQNTDALFQLAVLESLDDLKKAQGVLRQAAEFETVRNPQRESFQRAVVNAISAENQSASNLVLGRGLGNIGYWDLAEIAFSRAVAEDENLTEAWAFLGESKQQLGKSGKQEIETANRQDAQSVLVQVLTALYWRRQGRPEVAITYMHRAASAEPDQAMWALELGNILAEMGDIPGALAYYQKAVNMDSANGLYWEMLARFCIENEVDIRGIGLPAARQALLLDPEDSGALDLAGWAFLKLGDLISAERFLQQAIQKNPDNGSAHLHLSQLYLQSGENEKAYPHLKIASALEGQKTSTGALAERLLERYFGW